MHIDLLLLPYDSARRDERMGAGPSALVAGGLRSRLEERGRRVHRVVAIEPPAESWRAEIRTAFELAAALATEVRATRDTGRFPLVLTGNCGPAALGTMAALPEDTPVLWTDAHGDFNTPETTTGGFLDGMALATLTGRCWTQLARAQIAGHVPVAEQRVWLLGARDLDPAEADALHRSAIHRVGADAIGAELGEQLVRELTAGAEVRHPYVHVDLDVLDPSEGRANAYAAPAGVSLAALVACCAIIGRGAPLAAATISAYDPAGDPDGRMVDAAVQIVDALLG